MKLLTWLVLSMLLNLQLARADEPEDRVLRIVKELGGTAYHDELAPGRPLVAVHLAHRKVTDMHLKALAPALAALEHLHTLELCHTPVTDAGLKEIARLKQLQWCRWPRLG